MKKNVAFVTGGTTAEREISFKSAQTILKNLDTALFNVFTIIVDHDSWYYLTVSQQKVEINKNNFTLHLEGNVIHFDVVFIGIHGSPGEDGKLQGYFDMMHIPYTSCNALTSAITMNKGYTKAIVNGISELHLAKSVQLYHNQPYDIEKIANQLTFPVFVKPNDGGSSFGMSKVKEVSDLQTAIDKAFAEGKQVLIEEFVQGREFTVGIVRLNHEIVVLPITEVETKNEFFDVEAKYTPGVAIETTPAVIADSTRYRVEKIATETYLKLNCNGVVRMDFILQGHDEGEFYFIELNTIPGQTETSFIPQQVAAAGMDLKSFYTQLILESMTFH